MATVWEIAAHSVDHMFSVHVCFWLFVVLVISCFGFEVWIWDPIASVPSLCILFTFLYLIKLVSRVYSRRKHTHTRTMFVSGSSTSFYIKKFTTQNLIRIKL